MPENKDRPQYPNQPVNPKPYSVVEFDGSKLQRYRPMDYGHNKYRDNLFHGSFSLQLKVQTALHVSTGVVVMGKDVGSKVPLIKTMQTSQDKLTIPGSSLKGALRSIFEALTNSPLGVITGKYKSKMPVRLLPSKGEDLNPASLLFGAMSWQGLVHFKDAVGTSPGTQVGFMPSMYSPQPDKRVAYFINGLAVGRKFYYHAVAAVSGGDRGVPVQQVGKNYSFKTSIQFRNLSEAHLGALLISLGQDPDYPFAIKLGAGKPVGFGTVVVEVTHLECRDNLKSRYQSYRSDQSHKLEGEALRKRMEVAMQAAHQTQLVNKRALESLARILQWPTDREALRGNY
ncbi:RAMP superfamily CRISPR-associated protein [Lyngbya confervoides]|uniref:RAMP superfamily CRISPR-associated protein n=1 Tax=Lyngbya confervoides BDU141951 TaxID=1574623 RepID=A0ABD4T5U5_9CYAN|nr:RAMP superfamily CRISPR-associated protein [Lyngbya confervoides]MCM1984016.1 RAMP superfamily CRISPR-associated protein [Lyngbya confervoides BDU141951]